MGEDVLIAKNLEIGALVDALRNIRAQGQGAANRSFPLSRRVAEVSAS